MSTEIIVNNDIIEINVTEEPIIIEAPSGAYPLPTGVYSVYGRTGNVVAQEGDYTLTLLGDVAIVTPSTGQVLRYNGTAWVNSTESYVGTVTSVAASVPTGLTITGSPITTSGTLAFGLQTGYSIPTTASQTTWDTAYNRSLTSAAVTGTTTKTLTLNQQSGGTITASWTDDNTDAVTSVFGRTGAVIAQSGDYSTTQVTEGTNLYYTDVRARASNSFVAGSGAYNSTTGVITIPTNNNQITNGAAYITLTSLSASAPLSYSNTTGIFSISQATSSVNGYLTSTDWNTFNNKENAISTGTILQYWRGDKSWQTLDTTAVVEATNLYYTQARFNSAFAAKTTTDLTEGINLYYTDARARAAITGTSPISVTAGVVSITQSSASANGYLSSTDWSTFNNKQNQLNGTGFVKASGTTITYDNSTYLTTIEGITAGGELSGTYASPSLVNSAVTGKVLTGVNVTGGSISATDSILTAFGKVQNQINGLIGGSIYKGTWNANTNTPTLVSGVGTAGNYYIVSVAGTTNLDGITDWQVGDWAIFQGSVWQKVDNTDAVVSVNGFTGAVSLTTSNINEGTNLYYTNARTIASTLTGYTSGAGTITSSDTILTAIQKLNGNIGSIVSGVSSVFGRTGAVVSANGDYTTTQVTEGTNLYYTDTRARASLSFTAGSGAYNSTTGVITIPTNNNQITNGAGYITTADLTGYIPYTGATTAINLNAQSVVNISHLGINTTSVPTILLRVVGDNNSNSRIAIRGYSSNANSSSIRVTKFRGSAGTPQAPLSGDSLGKFELAGYGTTSSEGYPQASFEGLATENWGATARGTKTVVKVTPNTTINQVIALTINQDKSAVFESSVTGTSLIKTGGTSSQFLKADGTVDSSSYITLASLSATSPLSYNNTTGAFTIAQATTSTDGYLSSTDWNTFNGKQSALTFSSPLVNTAGIVSIPAATTSVNGYLTSTDWTTFNNKQNALTNPVTGTGTSGYLPKFTSSSAIGNSIIQDNGSTITITGTSELIRLTPTGVDNYIAFRNSAGTQVGDIGYDGRDADGLSIWNNNASGNLVFGAGGSRRMTITSAGNVGIGTSTTTGMLTFPLNTTNSQISTGSLEIQSYAINNSWVGDNLFFNGSNFKARNNGYIQQIYFNTDGSMGFITNSTSYTAGQTVSVAERMSIESGGRINIGTTTNNGALVFPRTTKNVAISPFDNDTLNITTLLTNSGRLRVENLGTGLLYTNGAILTSTNPSDSRLKENINDITWGLSEILKIRPVSYHWKDDKINQGVQFGFIAQEVQNVMPEAIKEFGEDVKYLGLEKDAIYGTLVKAIQEQQALITSLQSRLDNAGL
jgi:hypothetical protein